MYGPELYIWKSSASRGLLVLEVLMRSPWKNSYSKKGGEPRTEIWGRRTLVVGKKKRCQQRIRGGGWPREWAIQGVWSHQSPGKGGSPGRHLCGADTAWDKRHKATGDLKGKPLRGRMWEKLRRRRDSREGTVETSQLHTWIHRPNVATGLVLQSFIRTQRDYSFTCYCGLNCVTPKICILKS